MALPATDNFNRASIGANWTDQDGGIIIDTTSTKATGSVILGAFGNAAFWNADAFPANQYCQCVLHEGIAGSINGGPTTRASGTGSGTQFYLAAFTDSTAKLYLYQSGAFTVLQDLASSASIGGLDLIRLESNGTTHKVFKNGVQVGTDQTDATLASGAAGIYHYLSAVDRSMSDDFEAGALGGGAAGKPDYYYRQQRQFRAQLVARERFIRRAVRDIVTGRRAA